MKLAAKDLVALGFMTFAMYLGAGNLIFPPLLGYMSGENFVESMIGFLVTGVGLPAAALVVIALVNGSDNLTKALPKRAAVGFWVMLFIVIGPAFAVPRAITVAYQFTFAPFMGDDALAWFSALFCIVAILFSLYPTKLVDSLGKVLTPLLVLLLGALAFSVMYFPNLGHTMAQGAYQSEALAEGLTQGYMTMDALGSIGFGWIIFRAIQGMGVSEPKDITKYTLIAASMYAGAITLVYLVLAYIGLTSGYLETEFANGGEILTAYTQYHFGQVGTILLGIVILLACLTTAIGVTTAGAEFYSKTFNWAKYRYAVAFMMVSAALVANIGLNQLLTITLPAVVALHPIAIALMLVAVFRKRIGRMMAMVVVLVAALCGSADAMHIIGMMPETPHQWLEANWPLYQYYAGWLLPVVASLAVGVLTGSKPKQAQAAVA
ncbi:branched-chain amino acid transport system II carrier protein [Vibrio sp. SCSIO 43136]|uniref:branched-chain amino acid transport system II carrier protein n=1 Tax=Vibrio sp. SCSIO 43136 TaxID=2819101 RepID=UPI0020755647|nr:branched-chain amino acid transport system II carrier protein [Vibrio sp. SCSIO 43136]USD65433.1 branched-chain amino acid transport system II carrier protein [Vibrio sp. SCSIO 43136]